jgi:hypothetical protein
MEILAYEFDLSPGFISIVFLGGNNLVVVIIHQVLIGFVF